MILLQNIWVSEVDMPPWKALKYEEYVLVNGTYWYIGRRHILVLSHSWWVPLMEQELPTLPEHLNSLRVFSGVCVTQSLVLCVMFCRLLFVLFLLAIVLTPCSIYRFWLPLWYLQTLFPIEVGETTYTVSWMLL